MKRVGCDREGGLGGDYCAIDYLVSGLGTFGRDLTPIPKPQRAPSIVFTTENLHFVETYHSCSSSVLPINAWQLRQTN